MKRGYRVGEKNKAAVKGENPKDDKLRWRWRKSVVMRNAQCESE